MDSFVKDIDKCSMRELRREIAELREGKCRLNCRSVKEAFYAGFEAADDRLEIDAPDSWIEIADQAYKDWNNERP